MNYIPSTIAAILEMGCFCSKETFIIKGKKFLVKEVLGEGGFSVVYLVEDTHTGRNYAIKKIICHSNEDEKQALNEISTHQTVQHEYVVKLIDYDTCDAPDPAKSYFYLQLPFFERGTLLQELDRRGRSLRHFRPVEIYEMFLKICEGVRAFHESNPPLAHRDLKTANILLDNGDSPVIMDLGSAAPARVPINSNSDATLLQDTAAERCSMPYRAPELFHVDCQSVIDERTDIWSLGCILYAICFFKSPFDAVYERGDSVALAVLSGNIFFSEGQLYGQEMESLIRLMLRVNATDRPYISTVIERTAAALQSARLQADTAAA